MTDTLTDKRNMDFDPPTHHPDTGGTAMKRFSGISLILFFTGLLCIPCDLGADIAPLQVEGGAASAKSSHGTIRMESEEVTMRLEKKSYTVDALFVFSNSGETITQWVGFPKGYDHAQLGSQAFAGAGRNGTKRRLPDFIQFHAWVDGKPAYFSPEGIRWLARQVTFPGHAKTTIRVVYEADYYRGSYATYIISTGAPWKDTIARAAFTVDGAAIGGAKKFSARLEISGQSAKLVSDKAERFETRNYEPGPKDMLRVSCRR